MNERIKELAEQAGFETDRGPLIGPSPYIKVGGLCVGIPLEKFAELIIGHATECVRDVLRDENSDLSYDAATQVQNRIKEFFGVEE